MNLFVVYRNGSADLDEYESAIVVAESQEDAIQMLKTSLEEKYGEGQEWMWGNFNVTVKEVDLNEQKIILQMLSDPIDIDLLMYTCPVCHYRFFQNRAGNHS
jgi:inorganic pyrophosphatase/exopolyphosphatase